MGARFWTVVLNSKPPVGQLALRKILACCALPLSGLKLQSKGPGFSPGFSPQLNCGASVGTGVPVDELEVVGFHGRVEGHASPPGAKPWRPPRRLDPFQVGHRLHWLHWEHWDAGLVIHQTRPPLRGVIANTPSWVPRHGPAVFWDTVS
jgi:hypothetical protein